MCGGRTLSLPMSIQMLKYRADVLPDAPTRRSGSIRLTPPYVYVSRIVRNGDSVPEGTSQYDASKITSSLHCVPLGKH